jgi:hypothetical protein
MSGKYAEEDDEITDGKVPQYEDHSPTVTSVMLTGGHTPGAAQAHTDIRVTITSPTGLHAKRICVPGGVTAKKLGDLLASVADW